MTRLQRPALPNAGQLLNHILENPKLIESVRQLPGPILGKLVNSVGLEDAAEIVALASTQQLEAVFDEDLWQIGQSGWEERFDPQRFALWLHAFSEAGEESVIQRLLELPVDFVILAVHRLILVIDIDSLALEMSNSREDIDQVEKALESCLYEEWEEFRLIARDASVWDEINQALFALDRNHHTFLRQILERCAAMSSEWIDDNGGLYEVLSSDEMLESDMRAERDDRRAEKGFVSAADARAFLELARRGEGEPATRDPITKSYFRGLAATASTTATSRRGALAASTSNVASLLALLDEAEVISLTHAKRRAKSRTKRLAGNGIEAHELSVCTPPRLLDSALACLRGTDPDQYRERIEELAYLANVMIAAPRSDEQRLRPVEAMESALQITNRGLELMLSANEAHSHGQRRLLATDVLRVTTADLLFRRGFRRLVPA